LPAARCARAHDDRLQKPLGPDRRREAARGIGLEAAARLPWVRVDLVDGKLGELLSFFATDQDLEALAETSAVRRARQAPSPPSSTRPPRASGGRTRLRGARGSAPRRGARSGARS